MNKTGHSGPIVFLEVDPREEPFLKGLCPPAWPARFYRDEADRIDLVKIQDAEVLSVFIYSDLDRLLAESDVITLHCPLTDQTRHLIGEPEFRKMKKGVLMINTARGGLIDTGALLEALDKGIVKGAGLDVLEEEEAIREERELLSRRYDERKLRSVIHNHVLLNREDVIITPHIAFNSREAVERVLTTMVNNISSHLQGSPLNRVV